MEKKLIHILDELISCQSITPDDQGCQDFIAKYLEELGFEITKKKYGENDEYMSHLVSH